MNQPSQTTSKIGAGRSVVNRHERIYKRGSLMFIEGESSTEMFIVKTGKIRILKQEGECTVELAVLGPGSVLGELSLLDHQPRSATAQVIEDIAVTVIDEELLAKTLQDIPSWLGNLIQVVVKRLRDTMRRTSEDVVRRSVAGVIRVLLLLYESGMRSGSANGTISLARAKEIIYSVIGLSGLEAENVFLHLILKEVLLIRKNENGQEYLFLKNPEIMLLYMNYLRARQRGVAIVGEDFADETFDLIDLVIQAGERNGKKEGTRITRVGIQQLQIELERRMQERFVNMDALDQLVAAKLIVKEEETTSSTHGHHKRATLIYNEDTLRRVYLLKVWLPVFREEIRF